MRKLIYLILTGLFVSCSDSPDKVKQNKTVAEIEADSVKKGNRTSLEEQLKEEGYQTFSYKAGDTTYLMQQYYMVFLKSGPQRSQDSITAAELQQKHLAHLAWLYEEGYTSLTGPMGDDGEIRGMVLFNTPTQKEADSLANLDPMVKAGRLVVEVHPWWVAKGGKLK
jgi:uncharacterized protein